MKKTTAAAAPVHNRTVGNQVVQVCFLSGSNPSSTVYRLPKLSPDQVQVLNRLNKIMLKSAKVKREEAMEAKEKEKNGGGVQEIATATATSTAKAKAEAKAKTIDFIDYNPRPSALVQGKHSPEVFADIIYFNVLLQDACLKYDERETAALMKLVKNLPSRPWKSDAGRWSLKTLKIVSKMDPSLRRCFIPSIKLDSPAAPPPPPTTTLPSQYGEV
jgi:hypothetical protein